MTSEAIARFGRIDILVNNAGNAGPSDPNISPKPFWETSPEEWEPFIATNFNGVMNCCKAVLPSMTQHRGGRIITIISDAGRVGEPHLAAYSGAKAGAAGRSEEHTSDLQSLMRISYAVFCLKQKKITEVYIQKTI